MSITFDYLPESNRKFIKDAYDVITRNEWWGIFRQALQTRGVQEGFMWTTDPLYNMIINAVSSTHIGGLHSGTSIALTMRGMQYIALHGEPAYRRRVAQQNQQPIIVTPEKQESEFNYEQLLTVIDIIIQM
jgi:hypothetical protein